MVKFIITLIIIAAAVYVFRVLAPDTRREIGDPVLSLSPTATENVAPVASGTQGPELPTITP